MNFRRTPALSNLEFHDGYRWILGAKTFSCQGGGRKEIEVHEEDKVIVTLGSMVEGSSLGSMDSAPENCRQIRKWRCVERFGRR